MERNRLDKLLQLRKQLDAQIARESARQGVANPVASRGIGYVVLPSETLAHAAAQLAAAAERWGTDRRG